MTCEGVQCVTVVFGMRDGETARQLIIEGRIDEGATFEQIVAADRRLHRRVVHEGRLLGHDVDGAADDVAAVQGALGSAQDLQPFDVEEVGEHGAAPST